MKFKINYLLAFIFVLLLPIFLSANSSGEIPSQRPDLKVSKISPVGGLCVGPAVNKIRVTVTNSQQVGVNKKIKVKLTLTQAGYQPISWVKYINGIGPNDNYGQSVTFPGIKIAKLGSASFKATVNPDKQIPETTYNNNSKIQKFNVTKKCGSGGGGGGKKAKLTVTTFREGSWKGPSNYKPVPGAKVVLVKGSSSIGDGYTDGNGKKIFSSVYTGSMKIKVSKKGCQSVVKNYNMPNYHAKVNIAMKCNVGSPGF